MSSRAPTASELPTALGAGKPPSAPAVRYDLGVRLRANSEYVAIPVFALLMAAILFALFLLAIGKSPAEFIDYVWRGGFGTAFSFQNTLQRSSPLILTALAVAIPARIGLIMIGGEGALVLGGFASAAIAVPMVGAVPPIVVIPIMVATALAGRRRLGRNRRLSQVRARRQRDHLVAAADLHRHRDHELLRRRRDARLRATPTSPRPSRSATPTWSATSPAQMCIGASPWA